MMRSPCDPPKFDEQDWSQFDFSRWHLDGVQLDSTAAAIAELANRLFASGEWNDNFKAGLPELQKEAVALYQQNSTDLQAEKTATAAEFEQRIKAAQDQSAELSHGSEATTAPLIVPATSDSYHAVVKVTDSSGRLGLPGLTVQLMDPRNPDVPLGQAMTDVSGNAVLSIMAETARNWTASIRRSAL